MVIGIGDPGISLTRWLEDYDQGWGMNFCINKPMDKMMGVLSNLLNYVIATLKFYFHF